MNKITVDVSRTGGAIKPVNAVNNGPSGSSVRGITNFEYYRALEIPYARNHDASFYSVYGGEHTVDVHRIFKNFDADETDPASYVFAPTDRYTQTILAAGTKVFYRLGASIEHGYKEGTYPPRDYLKWARICEHIIRHYTEGWANGFTYDIEYWEIWNEPDCINPDGSNPCWQGTEAEFIDFYCTAATYLKEKFPHLKIGGPAFASVSETKQFAIDFLREVKRRNATLDFFSFHGYLKDPQKMLDRTNAAQELLADAGLSGVELHYNEWNYVRAWLGEDYQYSRIQSKRLKGASLIASVMCVGQASPLDMLMYYDARPCSWCGLFDTDMLFPLKPYYTFYLFRELRRLGTHIPTDYRVGNVYNCAATDGRSAAVILSNYSDDDSAPAESLTLSLQNLPAKATLEIYTLDEDHDGELTETREISGDTELTLTVPLFTTLLVKINA
ncbi:MAG: hypothetical protein IJX62_06825 [Clostridia bacterium]|nr:hypothetical protein [Clostridia bacterium]